MQHAPCVPGGQGFGEQLVAVTTVVPVGHALPLYTLHRPVIVLQHNTDGGTHGFEGVQVEPVPAQIPGAGQAAAFATMLHTVAPAAFTVQQAPWLAGGHGLGKQLVAVTEI